MRNKVCKSCKEKFSPRSTTQQACSIECAIILASKKKEKDSKLKLRQDKLKLKTRAVWLREAQSVFNKYIRQRDKDAPCISCGRYHNGQYHAGHYRSVGANPELRFDELNNHKQCSACNNHLSGNIVEYRKNLLVKIGQEKLDLLEGPHEPKKYTIDEIKAIKTHFKTKLKE